MTESETDLKEAVAQELFLRKGVFGDNMPKLIEYLRERLGRDCSKTRLQAEVNSLIHEGQIVRKRFKPKPVSVAGTVGEEGVILYHSAYKDAPETDFPKEFRDFLKLHHGYALAAR